MCLVSASILHDLSDMQPQINAIKIEHPPYYCSSYTPPSAATAADHAQPAASFSKFQNLHPYLTFSFLTFNSYFYSHTLYFHHSSFFLFQISSTFIFFIQNFLIFHFFIQNFIIFYSKYQCLQFFFQNRL